MKALPHSRSAKRVEQPAAATPTPEWSGGERSCGLLTRRELAAWCQVDLRTVGRWQAEGVVPFIKVGEVIRFHWPTTVAHLLAHFTVLNDEAEAESRTQKTEMEVRHLSPALSPIEAERERKKRI